MARPMAFSQSPACPTHRPLVRPGPKFSLQFGPRWPVWSSLTVQSHQMVVRGFGPNKIGAWVISRNPSAHFHSSSLPSCLHRMRPIDAQRLVSEARKTMMPPRPPHRWAHPLMGGCATVKWLLSGALCTHADLGSMMRGSIDGTTSAGIVLLPA
jgi:hypothetical protein